MARNRAQKWGQWAENQIFADYNMFWSTSQKGIFLHVNWPNYPPLFPSSPWLQHSYIHMYMYITLVLERRRRKKKERDHLARALDLRNGRWIRVTHATKSKNIPLLNSLVHVCLPRDPCTFVIKKTWPMLSYSRLLVAPFSHRVR